MSAIRIFIGTDDGQAVSTAVLKHSIMSRTSSEVDLRELKDLRTGLEDRFYTGFSFYRWGIPSFCDFTGRAIYLDTDIVALCDVRELWEMGMGDHSHLCRPRPRFRRRGFRLQRLGGAYEAGAVDLTAIEADIARGHIHAQIPDWCTQDAVTV